MKIQLNISESEQLQSKPAVLLAEEAGLTVAAVKRAMKCGAVWLTRRGAHKRVRRADAKLKLGDELAMYYNEQVLNQQVEPCQLLHDEGDFSLWYKPAGVLSQGSLWGDHTTINRFVEAYFTPLRPAFIVSRLDKSASGLMIIAHGKSSAAKLSSLFESRKIEKQYCAIVEGDAGVLNNVRIELPVDEKNACSIVNCEQVSCVDGVTNSLLNVRIETGRKHQIRKHLSSSGFPIRGDRLYGNAVEGEVDLQLRCCYLS
ncbi:MAG: RNA pseudouridine synthase, partial [Sinobacterium sp.]|nr:RNA pseudouridine synthase [Sinobacterium sp.]